MIAAAAHPGWLPSLGANLRWATRATARFFRASLQFALAYRSTMLFWMLWRITTFLTTVALWSAIYAEPGREVIGGYTLAEMTAYYLLVQVVFSATMSFSEFSMIEEIRGGQLAASLTQPYGFARRSIVSSLAWNGLQFLVACAIFAVLGVATGVPFGTHVHLVQLPLFALSLVVGMVFGATLSVLMGSATFWLPEPQAVFALKFGSFWFLSGLVVPFTVFPELVRPILPHLPFPVVAATPVRFLTTELGGVEAALVLLEQVGWTALLCLLTWRVWTRGLRRFESAGG